MHAVLAKDIENIEGTLERELTTEEKVIQSELQKDLQEAKRLLEQVR